MPNDALKEKLGPALLQDEPMAKYTAARLGGRADWLFIVRDSLENLVDVVKSAWAQEMPVRVIGGGANILVADRGIRGLVVINKVSEITFGDWHDGRTVSATSGTPLTLLANRCQAMGYAGMEWAVSVPGTVGGAVVNNAGAHGADMAASVADVVIYEPAGPRMLTRDRLNYAYRYSTLKARDDRRFLVVMATFALPKDDPAVIKQRMNEFVAHRKQTQPGGASLGSIFKNPPGDYAGRLIESVGLKGYRIGDVMISDRHANFFVNVGGGRATASDYRKLIEHARHTVFEQTGIMLELEIELVGDWPGER
jgi:UDP-N-acetylmuramate dehydrogenase